MVYKEFTTAKQQYQLGIMLMFSQMGRIGSTTVMIIRINM